MMELCVVEWKDGSVVTSFVTVKPDLDGYVATFADGRVEKLPYFPVFAYAIGKRSVIATNKADAMNLLSAMAADETVLLEKKLEEVRAYSDKLLEALLSS